MGNHPRPVRSIDRRRRLAPRDYLTDPHRFGLDPTASFIVPDGGDQQSMEIARVIHLCVVAWRRVEHRPSGADLGRRYGFSRQTWSLITQGRRWPGHTVLAATIAALNPAFGGR
jgi:hypothetical protein